MNSIKKDINFAENVLGFAIDKSKFKPMNNRVMDALTNPNTTHYMHEGHSFTGSPDWERYIQYKNHARYRDVDINKSNMLLRYQNISDRSWHGYSITKDQLDKLMKFINSYNSKTVYPFGK